MIPALPQWDDPATLVGLVAIVITSAALVRKSDRGLLLIMGIGVSFWALHYWLMGLVPATVIHAIAAVSILCSHALRNWTLRVRYQVGISFSALGVGAAMAYGTGPADVVAAVGCVLMTMSQFVARGTTRRYGFLSGEALFFAYALMVGSYPGMAVTLINIGANIIGTSQMRRATPATA